MSYEAMAKVRGSGLTDGTIVDVLEALAFCLNEKSGKCCPSTERIAQLARRSPNIVRLTLKKLELDGLISSSQLPGRERHFKLFLDRLPKPKPLSKVKGVAKVEPLSEVTGDPCQKCEGTPVRSERGPLSEVKPEQGSEQGKEQGSEQVVVSPAKADSPPPMSDEEVEALAQQDEELPAIEDTDLFTQVGQKVEVEPQVPSKPAAKKQRSKVKLEKPKNVPQDVFDDWVAFKRNRCKGCTPRMLNGLIRVATEAGVTVEQAMLYQLEQGYMGVTVNGLQGYYRNKKQSQNNYTAEDYSGWLTGM